MSALKLLVGKHIGQRIRPNIYQIVKKKEEKPVSMCKFIDEFLFRLLGAGRWDAEKARLLSDPWPSPAKYATHAGI